jgi:hypothetical protein
VDGAAAAQGNAATIETMLRAHVLDYLGNKQVSRESLGIEKVNGSSFGMLANMQIPKMATSYRNGQPAEGSLMTVVFAVPPDARAARRGARPTPAFSVTAKADGNGGYKEVSELEMEDGTRIQLKNGDSYVFKGGRWNKE